MPGVYFTTTEFLDDAKSAASDRGMPGIRMLALPADKYYVARSNKQEVQEIVNQFFDRMVDDLTRPLTAEEAHPSQARKLLENANIKVTGKDYVDAAQKVNDLFLDSRWADGLPIVPPTPELVKAMEAGTTLPPDKVIGQVAVKGGTGTVEKIAINSVMAGAKPEYFPVILAAMEGFTDKHYDLTHVMASTGSFTPVVIVDGPIAKELNFNSGIGMLGIGWRANSTVGRALELSLLNIGQTWPQVNFMGLTGRLEGYTFYTFSEDTAKSPWEPYNVSQGFEKGDSTVTVSSAGNPSVFGGGAVAPWTAQGVIDQMVASIRNRGVAWPHAQKHIIVLHPDCAVELANHGYTRKSLQEYFYEQTRVPYERLVGGTAAFGEGSEEALIRASVADGRIRPDRAQIFLDNLKPGGRVPVVQSPDDFHIVVAGGSPGYDLLFTYPGTNWAHQTVKIAGATLTQAGK
ncbi:MAG TPA: UGSC family (seleno)protein [Candidatus Acidoferrales bacterium]|nr:UGSC family (seleno)protein [Candidatus Acidoferrales bacterium]